MAEVRHFGMCLLQHEDSALVHRRPHLDKPKHLWKRLWNCTGHSKWGQEPTWIHPWKWKSPSSLWPHGLYSPWNSPGQNTGAGSLSLLQGIFPTQALNPVLPHGRQILYQLSHKGSTNPPCSDTIPEWSLHSKVTCPWNQYLKMAGYSRLPPSVGPM